MIPSGRCSNPKYLKFQDKIFTVEVCFTHKTFLEASRREQAGITSSCHCGDRSYIFRDLIFKLYVRGISLATCLFSICLNRSSRLLQVDSKSTPSPDLGTEEDQHPRNKRQPHGDPTQQPTSPSVS